MKRREGGGKEKNQLWLEKPRLREDKNLKEKYDNQISRIPFNDWFHTMSSLLPTGTLIPLITDVLPSAGRHRVSEQSRCLYVRVLREKEKDCACES